MGNSSCKYTGISALECRSLHVGSLPAGLDAEGFRQMFDQEGYGTITFARFDPIKNCGIVQYNSSREAKLAIERMDERWHSGSQLTVRMTDTIFSDVVERLTQPVVIMLVLLFTLRIRFRMRKVPAWLASQSLFLCALRTLEGRLRLSSLPTV